MGHREYFLYSKSSRYTPEQIMEEMEKHIALDSEDVTVPTVFVMAKSTVIKDFLDLNEVPFYKGTVGVIISPEDIFIQELMNLFPAEMQEDLECKPQNIEPWQYRECFEDSPIVINGKSYQAELNDEEINEEEEDSL